MIEIVIVHSGLILVILQVFASVQNTVLLYWTYLCKNTCVKWSYDTFHRTICHYISLRIKANAWCLVESYVKIRKYNAAFSSQYCISDLHYSLS